LNINVGENPLGSSEGEGLNGIYSLKVSVFDVDENPPKFKIANGSGPYQLTISENEIYAGQVVAEDIPEVSGVEVTYSLSGGVDGELFWLDKKKGEIKFLTAPNYEIPRDFNRNNIYDIQVMATDGTFMVYQDIEITVVDANDLPEVVEPIFFGIEDQVLEGNLSFFDEDGDSFEYIKENNQPKYSTENGGTVQIFDDYSFSYTPPADFNSVDTFTLTLADPYGQVTRQVEISLEPVNDPPAAEDDYIFYTDLQRSNRLSFDVLANDHAGVDAPAAENYTLVSHTQPNVVQGFSNLGNGYFSYSPASGFLGEDTFTYTIADENDSASRSSATVRIWIAKTASFPDWTYLRHFGAYMETEDGWIYHDRLGWLYAESPKEIIMSATWIWSEVLGWFWTGEKYFEWIYMSEHKKWLHWEGDMTRSSNWFLRDKQDTVYDEDHFIRLGIRNEIIEILPNLEDLSNYIAEHEYFSRDQIVRIITELNRFNSSSTLNQIIEFDFQY
jgi:hypothetical protein